MAEQKAENSKKKKDRSKTFCQLIVALLVIFLIWWFSNCTVKTAEYTYRSDKIENSFRIAVLSDLHASDWGITNDKIMKRIDRAEPDAVFILGDMYSRGSEAELIEKPIELTEMICRAGYSVYFVSGEHDTKTEYLNALRAVGAEVMNYRSETVSINGNEVVIYGIDNVMFSDTFDLRHAFEPDSTKFNILLAHIPYYEKYSQFGADLTLCGDTHGYIVRLPLDYGPVYDTDTKQFFPKLRDDAPPCYDKGIFPYEGGTMVITSGIGSYPAPLRLNNRPEIAVVDVKPSGTEK